MELETESESESVSLNRTQNSIWVVMFVQRQITIRHTTSFAIRQIPNEQRIGRLLARSPSPRHRTHFTNLIILLSMELYYVIVEHILRLFSL